MPLPGRGIIMADVHPPIPFCLSIHSTISLFCLSIYSTFSFMNDKRALNIMLKNKCLDVGLVIGIGR